MFVKGFFGGILYSDDLEPVFEKIVLVVCQMASRR
jgi:hypothetical protein